MAGFRSSDCTTERGSKISVKQFLGDRYKYGTVVLSVTLVYCGQTVAWIKVPLGMEIGLGPGDTVLDGNPAPPPTERGTAAPLFGACL